MKTPKVSKERAAFASRKRHHHKLVPLFDDREHEQLVGYRCAGTLNVATNEIAPCAELFTQSGNVSEEFVPRSGPKHRIDLPRRSFSHARRLEAAA